MEQLPISISLLCIGGLVYPRVAAVGGAAYIVGRLLYGVGYRAQGSRGRYNGVLLLDSGLLLMLGASVLSAYTLGGGYSGMQKALMAFTRM